MKKPVILKSDVEIFGVATTLAVALIVTIFQTYRFGRKCEIDEIINIVADQGSTTLKFKSGKKSSEVTKIGMEIIK